MTCPWWSHVGYHPSFIHIIIIKFLFLFYFSVVSSFFLNPQVLFGSTSLPHPSWGGLSKWLCGADLHARLNHNIRPAEQGQCKKKEVLKELKMAQNCIYIRKYNIYIIQESCFFRFWQQNPVTTDNLQTEKSWAPGAKEDSYNSKLHIGKVWYLIQHQLQFDYQLFTKKSLVKILKKGQ